MFHLLGRMAYYAVIGVVGIVLIGPVLGIAGVLLPFALIGLLVFALYRGVQRLAGIRPAPRHRLALRAEPVCVPERFEEVKPVRPQVADEIPRPRRGRVLLEIVCGALVGGLIAAAVRWQAPELAGTVLPAVAAGAVVGYLVGGSTPRREQGAADPMLTMAPR